MLFDCGKRSVKPAMLAAVLWTTLAGTAAGTDARALQGRWAVDPADCTSNRYVWVFSNDRAGLFVDNGAVSGWRRATYAQGGEGVISVVLDGAPRREFRWRLSGPDEMATAEILENGRRVETRSFQVWRRCGG
ncbi:MAG: hypothetical protein JNK67_02370 [Alphaproteobacteria bacterium]|nr:hypothetical protein [Alphaproteobacteria bacterium]